ncbi:hypothetical protein JOC76_004786 [Neobacillus cucumis]|nr:hypothetical protein [Neobacillus cucumis]
MIKHLTKVSIYAIIYKLKYTVYNKVLLARGILFLLWEAIE